ncbi:MAG: methyltransferase [Candidatus Taylorbacteria bacterium CG11_big_fil_rev_8_21_14_0_20_46_11]|uniref:Methyltransferase n=1 Tax=Candidatus Taylorbacteria bacterium CG11_big_fil_rev_8_21_14_0_20_46_11 TaxID=1975025 RepID=A0A2H0KCR2_9BACT|nr:MAG: methyltransferase [Candidatus Taylorbacteria bacterium CG11_big_fil_rev_8_21_14_0_20_46_11]
MACFICSNEKIVKFLDLGLHPPSDAFLCKEDLDKPEAKYPLALYFCERCGLVQLGFVVDPEILFRDYVYTTGMNNSLRKNFKELVDELVLRFKIDSNDLAIDVGSNDGTLLENYASRGVPVLGVDPSSAGSIAVSKGMRTVCDFWNAQTAEKVVKEYGQAKVITATNVFAHVGDLTSFMQGMRTALRHDGVFVSESGYLLDMIETLGYDAIYHEHLRYYSLRPLIALFKQYDMEIIDVSRIQSHSGSIRVFAAHTGAYPASLGVKTLLREEEHKGLYDKRTYTQFSEHVLKHKQALVALLSELKTSGKRIVGIGAPAKGNTLLNFCHITPEVIDCLVEKSDLKIGLYTPGIHLPVLSESLLFEEQPDVALLLSWNLAEELIQKLRQKGFKGEFIIPFPEPRVVH